MLMPSPVRPSTTGLRSQIGSMPRAEESKTYCASISLLAAKPPVAMMTFLAWMMSLSPDFVVASTPVTRPSVMMSLVTRVFVRSSPPRALMFSIQRRMTSAVPPLNRCQHISDSSFGYIVRMPRSSTPMSMISSIVRVDSSMRTRSTAGSARKWWDWRAASRTCWAVVLMPWAFWYFVLMPSEPSGMMPAPPRNGSFSMTSALQPLLTAAFAAERPPRPPPTITRSRVSSFTAAKADGMPGMAAMTAAPPMS